MSAREGLLLVVSGPSGVGKTTIVHEIVKRLGGVFSISATTRPQSDGEVDGADYFFITRDRFREMIDAGDFLEHATVFGENWYGTPRGPVDENLAAGRLVVLEIDVQGGTQVRGRAPDAYMLFIAPPNDDELLRRLRGRGREPEEIIQRRFAEAQREITLARDSGAYDEFIINDRLEQAIDATCALIERRRSPARQGSRE